MGEKLEIKADDRGRLVSVFQFPKDVGEVFFSTSKPGAVRGRHYHLRKTEHFCVIAGTAKIRLRDRVTNELREYLVSGDEPEIVKTIINWTHDITNTGETEMILLVWSDEVFDPNDPDTFFEEV